MKIIIPMAGLGTRFAKDKDKNPEYKKPKPFIKVKNLPMVRWATGSLPFLRHPENKKDKKYLLEPKDMIFIILKEHNDEHNLEKGLREIYSDDINVIIQKTPPVGATDTAYLAKDFIDPDEDILISDSDHYFDGTYLEKAIINKKPETTGIIPVFVARNEGIPKWSYSLLEKDSNFIKQVGEKDRALMEAGAHANIGAYYFSKAKYFFDEAEKMIKANRKFGEVGKAEYYIAPMYQTLIEKGMKVEAAIIPVVWGLGTPSDLEYFLINSKEKNP